jgi:hypothetical protein
VRENRSGEFGVPYLKITAFAAFACYRGLGWRNVSALGGIATAMASAVMGRLPAPGGPRLGEVIGRGWRLSSRPFGQHREEAARADPVWLEPPSAAFHCSESFKKFPKVSARLPKRSENRRFLSDSRRKLQEKD